MGAEAEPKGSKIQDSVFPSQIINRVSIGICKFTFKYKKQNTEVTSNLLIT